MKSWSRVEPPEPMRGLEVPPAVVAALGGGARPQVTITVNGHSWKSRVAIMRGRHLLGLSNANRQAAGVAIGEEVEVELELDTEPRVVVEPPDFARALDDDPVARAAYDNLAYGRKHEHVRAIESAKRPETRRRRIEKAIAKVCGDGLTPRAVHQLVRLGTTHVSTSPHRTRSMPSFTHSCASFPPRAGSPCPAPPD